MISYPDVVPGEPDPTGASSLCLMAVRSRGEGVAGCKSERPLLRLAAAGR